ncbi:MAG: CvpA family protein [Pseudomonadota bacterium]
MPIIDILIIVALLISIVIGILRGFVKEAISIVALLVAIWAAMYFGPGVGTAADTWISSKGLQAWAGRVIVFLVVLALGGLIGWGISKIVLSSVLSGIDRFVGAIFGLVRGILLAALFVLGGQYAGFDQDEWWQESRFIPYLVPVAEWIRVMAPEGLDMLVPDGIGDVPDLPVEL